MDGTRITLVIGWHETRDAVARAAGNTGDVWHGTVGEFLLANPDTTAAELATMAGALASGKPHLMGGGAGARFTVIASLTPEEMRLTPDESRDYRETETTIH